jgi:hypothetical protein
MARKKKVKKKDADPDRRHSQHGRQSSPSWEPLLLKHPDSERLVLAEQDYRTSRKKNGSASPRE